MVARASTPAAYARQVEAARRGEFSELRSFVKKLLPRAKETFQYRMPTFEDPKTGSAICAIAAQKNYLALYVCRHGALEPHREEFAHLNVGKGCIRFRKLDDLPRGAARVVLRAAAREAKNAD